ncbi:mks-3 [Pristionchus pacificus]|nr:mks-3 [Pristionchus pacificus]
MLLVLFLVPPSLAQILSNVLLTFPSGCNSTDYFDASHLVCIPCRNGSVPSSDSFSCVCSNRQRLVQVTPGGPICQDCPQGTVTAPDGLSCIGCSGQTNCSTSCPSDSVAVYRKTDGSLPEVSGVECVRCASGTTPDSGQERCEKCSDRSCLCSEASSSPTCPSSLNVIPSPSLSTIFLSSGDIVSTRINTTILISTARRCQLGSQIDCQALGNVCVLQNYQRDVQTACTVFESISNAPAVNQWAANMPWLFYYSSDAVSELQREAIIDQIYKFTKDQSGELDILAARYTLHGSFLGLKEISDGSIQLCVESLVAAHKTFTFGTRIRQSCQLDVAELMRHEEPLFFDLYLRFTNSQRVKQMYPLPVVNENIRRTGGYPNREERPAQWILTRRFFLVDAWSLKEGEIGNWTALRYASNIELNIEMVNTRDGKIYPPYLRIVYDELRANDIVPAKEVDASFSIRYYTNPFRHDKDLEIAMAVLSSLTVLWSALRAYSWGRRAGKAVFDVATLIQFLLFECSFLGDVFLFVTTVTVCWLTFAYKAQTALFYMQLTDSQESTLMAYLISATSLKFVALLHRFVSLMLTETFFIDWERPKVLPRSDLDRPASLDPIKYDGAKEQAVVIWRTYLVANEWNELQNYRKTSMAVQVLAMVFFLDFLHWKDLAIWQPGFEIDPISSSFASSRVSRLAVSLFFYFAIGFTQWLLNVFIVERILLDPFHNFIDLCSIANISVLSLSHPLYGFYIHGRSVHGWADTGMAEMNEFLQRERDNLVGMRGLESGGELQTYYVSLPLSFRKRYSDLASASSIDASGATARIQNVDPTTIQISSRARTHAAMNRFLQDMVEHSLPEVDYTIRERTMAEAALDIELSDSSQMGVFTRDHSESAFARCFVYGNEWAKLSFEALLFSIVFVYTSSVPLAAVITYVSAVSLRMLASMMFTNHLVKSSLVDHRFLI